LAIVVPIVAVVLALVTVGIVLALLFSPFLFLWAKEKRKREIERWKKELERWR
jgi:Flp pilus assembly protein TadB